MGKFVKWINVPFSVQEYDELLKKKGKATWHDYILNTSGVRDIEC